MRSLSLVRSLSLRWSVSADMALSEKSPYLGSAWVRWVLGGPLDVARGPPVRWGSLSLSLVGPARDFNPLKSALWRAHQKKGPRRSDGGPKKNRGASQRMTIRPGE